MRIFLAFFVMLLAQVGTILAQEDIEDRAIEPPERDELQQFELLEAYDSYFEQAADFGWSFVRFRPRGYEWRYRAQRVGGITLSDWFRGGPAWGAISGLSAAGVTTPQLSFSSLGPPHSVGTLDNLDIAPWRQTPGGRISLSAGNRSYALRGVVRYARGEHKKNGWAYSVLASGAAGQSPRIDGVWNRSATLFGSLSKRLGDHNRLSITAFYTPSERALQSAATAEAFALTGDNLYNPLWGWDGTRQRSVNIRKAGQPVFQLAHHYQNDRTALTTTLMARLGEESYRGLSWQNAPNPRPDYYRYLPSFYADPATRERVAELWRTEESVRQIDWQAMVNLNTTDPRAHYIVEERVRDYLEYSLGSQLNHKLNPYTSLGAGVDVRWADNLNFKRLDDLLGASYWLDIDSFVENADDTGNGTQSNLHTPDRRVGEGQEFGYKYAMQTLDASAWVGLRHQKNRLDFGLSLSGGGVQHRRFGYYQKENFPGGQSFGYSEPLARAQWLGHAEAGYRLGGRLRAAIGLRAQSLAPLPTNSFISPEYRNAVLPELKNEQVLGIELRFDYRTPGLRLYAAGFLTQFTDRTQVSYFYDDLQHFYCNYILEGIDARHAGVELSAQVTLADNLTLSAAGALMDNRFTSDPFATQWRDATGQEVLTERVYYRGLRIPTGPQRVGALNLQYTPRSWTFSATLVGYGASFIAPAPLRRTTRAARAAGGAQEELGGGWTIDLFLGKTVYLRGGHRLGFYAGLNNLLDRRDIRTGGYESQRLRPNAAGQLRPLDSKYYYHQGLNGFFTASYRF